MQLLDQFAELGAGGTVDPGHCSITGKRVAAGGDEGVQALAVGAAQRSMLVAQALDLSGQLRFVGTQHEQIAKNLLHLGFLCLELAPVAVAIFELLAAQQHVLPFLHLHLELEVGLVDQLQLGQRPVEQCLELFNIAAEQADAAEGDEERQQQAAADQREDLRAQGLLEHGQGLVV